MKRQAAERGGRRAEAKVALWLQLKGYRILGRRVRTPLGEVDIIARRGKAVAFVEVKARSTFEHAALSLDDFRLRRVVAAAEALTQRYARPGDHVRIDAVYIVPRRLPRHAKDIWRG